MALHIMHKGKLGGFFKFIIFGLLGVAIVGMTLMDIGRSFNSGVNSMDVAKIEGKHVTIQNFDRILRRQLSQYNISPQEAYTDGTLQGILANEIRANFVDIEAEKFGISLNKEYIQKRVAEMVAPNVKKGETMQQTLNSILRSQNLDEQTFVKGINREISADFITESIKSAFPPTQDSLAKDLFLFQNQTRDLEYLTLTNDSITTVKPATEDQLKDIYNKLKDTTYATPELRKVKIAILDSDTISKSVVVSDEEVKKYYEDNKKDFIIAKQTILSQIIIPDIKEAQEIVDLVKNGEDFKTAAAKIVKDKVKFFEKIPFDMGMMIPQITEALENKKIGDVVGPINTQLGNHIVRLDGYTEEKAQDFDTVKESIRNELLNTKKLDVVFKNSQTFDDLIAGGAGFDEISKEVPLKIYNVPALSRYGLNKNDQDALTTLPPELNNDKTLLTETAFETQSGEISRILELPTGNFASINVESIQEKTPKPYEEVKQKIVDTFTHDQKVGFNQDRVAKFIKDLNDKKILLKDLAAKEKLQIKSVSKLSIGGKIVSPFSDNDRPVMFKAPIGGFESIAKENGIIIVHITAYGLPEISDKEKEQVTAIQEKLGEEMKGEAFAMYLDFLAKKYTAIINEPLLKQAYAPKKIESQ